MTSISTVGTTDASSYASSTTSTRKHKGGGKIGEDFESLQKALDSGDLSAAKSAFSTLQTDFKNGPPKPPDGDSDDASSSSASSASGTSSTSKGPDLSALQTALESGDLSAAKSALTELQKNAPKGHHHRHGSGSGDGSVSATDSSSSIDAFLQALQGASGSSSSSSTTASSSSSDPFGYSGQSLDLFA
jgi:hypothetical protein